MNSSNNSKHTRRRWTEDEKKFLMENSSKFSIKELAIKFNRSQMNISTTLCDAGLKAKPPANKWYPYDIKFITDNYKDMTNEEMASALNRSEGSVSLKCQKLGLKKNICVNRKTKSQEYTTIWAKFNNYKSNARRDQKVFNISFEQFYSIVTGTCYYCGDSPKESFVYQSRKEVRKETVENSKAFLNGIDRIENKIGYEFENCVTACTPCNIAKSTYSYKDFIERCVKIAKKHGKL